MNPEAPITPDIVPVREHWHQHPMVQEATRFAVNTVVNSPELLKAALESSVTAIEVAKTAIGKIAGSAGHLVSPSVVSAEVQRLYEHLRQHDQKME